MKKALKIGASVAIFLLVLEGLMHLFGMFSVYSERTTGRYLSYYGHEQPGPYHTWTPDSPIRYRQPEFSYEYPANSDGFRETEFPTAPDDSTDVVYVLGDSFVEGDGAPYDSTMPRFLERRFHREGYNRVKVYAVGVCGNDPVFSYRFFADKLLKTDPKLVLLVSNSSDNDDLFFRGGFERFTAAGGVKYPPAPPGHWLYRYSRIARLFFSLAGYREGMVPPADQIDYDKIEETIAGTFIRLDSLCATADIPFGGVGHPFPNTSPDDPGFDTYPAGIGKRLAGKNSPFPYLDISPGIADSLRSRPARYYAWRVNGHFNSKGYAMMADVLYTGLRNAPGLFAGLHR